MGAIDLSTTVRVRPMRSCDHGDVLAIAGGLPEWFTPKGVQMIAFDLTRQHGLVAIGQRRPIGFVTYTCWKGVCYIGWMAICRQWHRRGVGRQLLAELERRLVRRGVRFVQVQTLGKAGTSEVYVSTRAFYRGMGFEEDRTYPCGDPDWPETLVLRKQLTLDGRDSGPDGGGELVSTPGQTKPYSSGSAEPAS